MDFIPAMTEGGGFFSSPVFCTLNTCLNSANSWLEQNPTARLISCETITMRGLYGSTYEFHSEFSMFTDHYVRKSGKSSHTYGSSELKGLRVWYMPDNQGPPQRLAYNTLVPTLINASGKPQFESFQETIGRYNQQRAYNAPPGVILNIETVVQKCGTSGKMDPERTCYQQKQYGLNLIRVWYLVGPAAVAEEIGCADFVPQMTQVGAEPVSVLHRRAADWLQTQSGGVRFTNMQALHYKPKGQGDAADAQRPLSHYWVCTEMFQFLRVWYAKPLSNVQMPNAPCLSYFTFEPAKARTGGAREYKFETVHQMSTRLYGWLTQCGARVLGIQTFLVPCKTGSMQYPSEDARHVLKMNSKVNLRIYFDGEFREPWAGSIPNPPPVTDGSSCEIV